MRIVIINQHPSDTIGGSEIQCDIIAKKLTDFGHSVFFLAVRGKGEYNNSYSTIPVKRNGRAIANAVITIKPDVVYWRYNTNVFYSSIRKIKGKGIPVVFAVSHIRDTIKWKKPAWALLKKLQIKSFAYSIKLAFESRWNYRGYKYVDGVTVNNADLINKITINNRAYVPNSNTDATVMFSWSKPYVCWIANIKKRKQPELVIYLAKELEQLNVDILMAGKIQDQSYSYFKNKDQLPANLFYLGPKSVVEVNGIIKNSICLVHTCQPEGFPGNFIQAWLQGKPVVSYEFDPGGLISKEKLGLVSNASFETFVKDVKSMISDSDLNNEWGENAKKYANKHFNQTTNVRHLESFLKRIVENTKACMRMDKPGSI